MKRIIILVIIAVFVLSACAAQNGAAQGGTTNSTMLANSTTSTTISTVPTTSANPTTITTMPTTVSTNPTTVTTASTTVSTTQPITSTKATTNTTKPTTNTTKPTTITNTPANSTTQAEDGFLYRGNQLNVYMKNGNYILDILVGGTVEISPDRVIVRAVGVKPIKCDNYQELLNCSFDEVKSMFGEPHFDEGSGMYIPSYITEDGYVLFLYANHGIVTTVDLADPTGNEEPKVWSIYDEQ